MFLYNFWHVQNSSLIGRWPSKLAFYRVPYNSGIGIPSRCPPLPECPEHDGLCKRDKLGYAAIYHLFAFIDLNNDRSLVSDETDVLIRNALGNTPTAVSRHAHYHKEHGDEDGVLLMKDMWRAWTSSEGLYIDTYL